MESSEKILRKLTFTEMVFDRMKTYEGCLMVSAVVIDSKIDLFKCKYLIENALSKMKKHHPLLRSKIIDDPVEKYKSYFAFASDKKQTQNDNILLLRYKSASYNIDECCKYLLEREINTPISNEDELLWRITFVDLSTIGDSHKYCVLGTFRHVITDGPSGFGSLFELMQTIESIYLNEEQTNNEQQLSQASAFERSYPNDPRLVAIDDIVNNDVDLFPVKALPYLKSNETNKTLNNMRDDGVFMTLDGQEYFNVNDIDKLTSKSEISIKIFNFEPCVLKALLSECKRNKVKLTSCIDLIIAIALKKVIKKYSKEVSFHDDTIRSKITISLRQFMDPPVDYCVMGYWITSFIQRYNKELEFDDNHRMDSWVNSFWYLAKLKCVDLHQFLRNKTFLEKPSFEDCERTSLRMLKYEETFNNEARVNYTLACMGQTFEEDPFKLFKLEKFYGGSFQAREKQKWAMHSVVTLNNSIFWSIGYNYAHLSDDAVESWIYYIKEIMQKIIQKNFTKSKL